MASTLDSIIQERFLKSTIKIYKHGKDYDDMKVVLTLEKQEGVPFKTLDIWINQGNEVFELTPIKI